MNTEVEITVTFDEVKLEEISQYVGAKSYETLVEILLHAKYSHLLDYRKKVALAREKKKREKIKGICPWCLESCGCSYWKDAKKCNGDTA